MSSSIAMEPAGTGELAAGKRLHEKVAVITGAANGIGRATALLFAAEGAHVIIADCDEPGAAGTVADITTWGGQAAAITMDITRPADVRLMVERTLDRCGRLDILINNAGVALNRPFLETSLEEWSHLLNVVLTGTFLCAQAAARAMLSQGSGTIINFASVSGQRGAQGRAAYGVAKAGVIQLTKVMAVELADKGIRVNAISPGPVDTNQSRGTHTAATRRSYHDRIPLHRYGQSSEIAAATLFLASDEASFIHGHVLNVDGGFHVAGLMFDPNA